MGILDKFKRKKPQDVLGEYNDNRTNQEPVPEAEVEDTTPELVEIVQDERVEPGIPQNLTLEGGKSMKRFAFLGVGIVAAGVAVAGLISFANSDSGQTDANTPQPPTQAENTRPKDFSKDKELIEQERLLAAAASNAAASEPQGTASEPIATAPVTTPMTVQPTGEVYQPPVQKEDPQQALRSRRMDGDVLFDVGGGNLFGGGSGSAAADGGNAPAQPAGSAGLFGSADTGNAGSDSGGTFAARLNGTVTASASAQRRGNLTYVLPKGTNIRCGLETRIITTQPGFTRCVVSNDVYSANGKVVLIERGSKIIGEQTAAMLQGQARVFVLWNEVETPTGVKVSLRSPGSGALGEAGQRAHVNYHFWQRFGGAVLISLINDFSNSLNNRNNRTSGNNNNITYENSSETAQEMATEALRNSINIPPTGTINQGTVLNIMVARDVNFDKVYEVVDTDGDF